MSSQALFMLVCLSWTFRGSREDSQLVIASRDDFCDEQDVKFQTCSSRMELNKLLRAQSLDTLCHEIAQYLSCVHETKLSCPEIPIFHDPVYIDAIQKSMIQLNRFCKGYAIQPDCTDRFVDRLVAQCTAILNQVQVDLPQEEMCQHSQEYLKCLQEAIDLCPNNSEFQRHNVYLAMESTQSTLVGNCDDMQNDSPTLTNSDSPPAVSRTNCSVQNVREQANKCLVHAHDPAGLVTAKTCRNQQTMKECLEDLVQGCPTAGSIYKIMLATALENFDFFCSFYRCPAPVVSGGEDCVSYCMSKLTGEPASLRYCRELEAFPNCINATSRLCPNCPSLPDSRLNRVLERIHRIIQDDCHTEP